MENMQESKQYLMELNFRTHRATIMAREGEERLDHRLVIFRKSKEILSRKKKLSIFKDTNEPRDSKEKNKKVRRLTGEVYVTVSITEQEEMDEVRETQGKEAVQ